MLRWLLFNSIYLCIIFTRFPAAQVTLVGQTLIHFSSLFSILFISNDDAGTRYQYDHLDRKVAQQKLNTQPIFSLHRLRLQIFVVLEYMIKSSMTILSHSDDQIPRCCSIGMFRIPLSSDLHNIKEEGCL